jgi:hypothetical protein
VGQALGDWLSSLPANSVVTLPSGACYRVDSSLIIHNTSGLTINGNGSLISQTKAGGQGTDVQGILYLRQNDNLTLNGLKVAGAFNGTNGGVSYEGNYGLFMEANHTVTVTGMNMSNIQGDFIILDPPQNNDTPGDNSLNTAVNIQSSTFTNAGYHGLTVESVNGLTVNNSTFTNMGVDAIDMEYDVYSTAFDAQGNPLQAAQDNVSITNDTWTNFQDDWFASIQGQSPGVQQDNVVLSNNTLDANSPLIQDIGTNPAITPAQYQNRGLTVTLNKNLMPAIGTSGASIADPNPGHVAAMQIQGVVNANISGNTFPLFDGLPDYFANTPYISVLQAYENPNLIVRSNSFVGAYNILQAGSAANTVTECGNEYGVIGLQGDGACPTTTTPITTTPTTTTPTTTTPTTTTPITTTPTTTTPITTTPTTTTPTTTTPTNTTPTTTTPTTTTPTTSVIIPPNGATVSGTTTLDATASNATSVEFRLFGGSYGYSGPVICTATPTLYGWLCSWNTTTMANGSYVLLSEAFNSGGSAFSPSVNITVNNLPTTTTPTTLHTASSNLNPNGGTAGSANSDSAAGDSWTPCSGSKCSARTLLPAVP